MSLPDADGLLVVLPGASDEGVIVSSDPSADDQVHRPAGKSSAQGS